MLYCIIFIYQSIALAETITNFLFDTNKNKSYFDENTFFVPFSQYVVETLFTNLSNYENKVLSFFVKFSAERLQRAYAFQYNKHLYIFSKFLFTRNILINFP